MDKLISQKNKSGFAMLYAVLVSSLLLAIGISIFNISIKELNIATSERDSQISFYAADSAIECAMYWGRKAGAFPQCFDTNCDVNNQNSVATSTSNTIICNGNPIKLSFQKDDTGLNFVYSTTSFFKFSATDITKPQSDITIINSFYPNGPSYPKNNTLEADGHNNGIVGRRVERARFQIF
jgi:hypothetical protein